MTTKYKLHQAGLGPIRRRVTVDAADTSEDASAEIERTLMAASPTGRLLTVKQRAKLHPSDPLLADEIEWVAQRLAHQNGNAEMADLFALTAIERGLDLLHTEQHLAAVLERARRRIKDKERGDKKASLPPAEKLRAMIDKMVAMGHGTEAHVKAVIADRYRVGIRAVNLRLKKPSRSN